MLSTFFKQIKTGISLALKKNSMSPGYLGYNDFFASSAQPFLEQGFAVARIIEENRESYVVRNDLVEVGAEVSGKLRFTASSREDFPAVGDWVVVSLFENSSAIIHCVLPRRTTIARKAAGNRTEKQIIAANVDVAFIVQGLDDNFNLRRLERYLVMVRDGGVQPVVLLSKVDLCSPEDLRLLIQEAQMTAPEVQIVEYSGVTGAGLDRVHSLIDYGKTICIVGSSGVGKSTLINRLVGQDLLPTQEVREADSHGRHTTTRRQMIILQDGGILIDTPGMRELALWQTDGSLDATFPEIVALAEGCLFRDCSHVHEPDCAVRTAAENGTLDAGRYESYLKLSKEAELVASQATVAGRLEKKRKDKILSKTIKRFYKSKGRR